MLARLVKTIVHCTLTFILKTQYAPDFKTVFNAFRIAHTEAKAAATSTTEGFNDIKNELKNTTDAVH